MKIRPLLAMAVGASIALTACTGAQSQAPSVEPTQTASEEPTGSAEPSAPTAEAAEVSLQLQWVPQAQFAGYFAAEAQGYYAEENLTVNLLDGGPTIIPQQVGSAPDGPEFTISWVPKVLEARETGGSDLVNIAQIFARSGTLSVTWADSGLDDPCDLAGKKVGVWDFGNEFEVTAGLLNCGYTPGLENGGDPASQYQKVIQAFDMVAFLNRQIDAAEAMIYNEYAQVLEAVNPDTGDLYQPEDMNVINWNDERVAMLQDAIFARQSWLEEGNNRDIAVRFVRASIRGWLYCRDNPDDCVQTVLEAGTALGAGHQAWQMNEVNGLIWPNQLGIGIVDPVFWQQTVRVSKGAEIITADPPASAYDQSIVEEATAGLEDQNLTGEGFEKAEIEPTPNGE